MVQQRAARTNGRDAAGHEGAELEDTQQIERDQREKNRQARHYQRRLQLETPAQHLTTRPKGKEQAGQRHKGSHDAHGIGQTACNQRLAVAGMLGKREHLERKDGKHAGHQVQKQTSAKSQRQREEQSSPARIRATSCNRTVAPLSVTNESWRRRSSESRISRGYRTLMG